MGVKTGTLHYDDGTTADVFASASDKIRARREYAKPEYAGATADELMLYTAYLAAKRAGLPYTELPFLRDASPCWADHIVEFNPELTVGMVDSLITNGQLSLEAGEALKDAVAARREASAQEETPGEATATPAS